eukprot:COSAG01_NODE_45348_length_410_cov_0.781350_1_plen_34_part_01
MYEYCISFGLAARLLDMSSTLQGSLEGFFLIRTR